MSGILADANPLTMRERCGQNMTACVAGVGIGVIIVLVLLLIYYWFFAKQERMANLASAYNPGSDTLRLAAGLTAGDPRISSTTPRKERMSENTKDSLAGYLWS